jgi:HD-GYP domain-containing protein (c-di-GMP phosphodiesterase class II)
LAADGRGFAQGILARRRLPWPSADSLEITICPKASAHLFRNGISSGSSWCFCPWSYGLSLGRAISSSFFHRLVILVLVAGGLPVFLVACLLVDSAAAALTREWRIAEKKIRDSVARVLDEHIQGCVGELGEIQRSIVGEDGTINPNAREVLRNWGQRDGLLQASLLYDEKTRMNPGALAGIEFFPLEAESAEAEATGSTTLTQPVFSRAQNEYVFGVGIPLSPGKKPGRIVGLFSIQPALNRIRDIAGPGVRALLTGPGFRVDLYGNAAGEALSGNGIPIKGTGWQLILSISESADHAEARTAIRSILKWSSLVLVFASLLSAGLALRLARPLWQLEESARQITAGFHAAQTPAQDRTEIGAVARSFQLMADQVRQHLHDMNAAIEDSRQLFTGILRAIASAIDAKDPYTSGHSERVTRFAMEIGRVMGLPEDDVDRIKLGALIHDVGKISVEDRILNKPSALTDEEFRIMKTHTTRGYDMMKHIPQLNDILPGLQSHHEQIDGNGYPEGLKGDEIPMIARVIMVADCFDAMTTKRPYQDPAPIAQVLDTIRSLAGRRYDEQVVDALIKGVESGRILPNNLS